MTVTRSKEYTFFGMKICYNEDRTAAVTMRGYLQEAIDKSGIEIKQMVTIPATRQLFEIDDAARPFPIQQAEHFHRMAAKLLFLTMRACMDLSLAVAFLCTRVARVTTQDLENLKRVLEYVKGTIDLLYTVGADYIGRLRYWVDASYAVAEPHGWRNLFWTGRCGVQVQQAQAQHARLHRGRDCGSERLPPECHLGEALP
jgi:hypothetical protein